jgi:predicted methyltransferase
MDMMKRRTVVDRDSEYIDLDTHTIDINKCVAGSNARAIKPGGVVAIKNSIIANGYGRVHTPDLTVCRAPQCLHMGIHPSSFQ